MASKMLRQPVANFTTYKMPIWLNYWDVSKLFRLMDFSTLVLMVFALIVVSPVEWAILSFHARNRLMVSVMMINFVPPYCGSTLFVVYQCL